MNGFELQRLGILMEPQPGDPHEAEGVLNPAAAPWPGRQAVPLSAAGCAWELLAHRHCPSAFQ